MFTFDEKNLYPPRPEMGMFPHEKPRYTMIEEVEHTAREMRNTIDRLLKFEQRLKTDVEDLMNHLSSDNVIFKQTFSEAHKLFLQEVKNEVNAFEGNVDATVKVFMDNLTSDYATLSEDTKAQINENLTNYENALNEYKTAYESAFSTLSTNLQAQYNSFVTLVNERIDSNNNTHEQAFQDYCQKLTTNINLFEADVNSRHNTFTEHINHDFETFKTTWTQIVEERLNTQDGKLSDAEMYMKTNLVATITSLIGDMHESGEFVNIIEGEVFNDIQKHLDVSVNVKKLGAVGDGVTDDTIILKTALALYDNIYIPDGKYLITETINCNGKTITGGFDSFLIFNNANGDGLIVGNGYVKNINLVMMNEFSGSLLKYEALSEESYPDRAIFENISLYSLNDTFVGTFLEIIPNGTYAGVFEKIRIGRRNDIIDTHYNKAENALLVNVPSDGWATGYTFRDIIVDACVYNPLTVNGVDYTKTLNFTFENVQIQTRKIDGSTFKHNYLAYFKAINNLRILNCKIWDYDATKVNKRIVYYDCPNVVTRNSNVFEKYYDSVDPFEYTNNKFTIGTGETLKMFNSDFSDDNGYSGRCKVVKVEEAQEEAVPVFFPYDYKDYSKSTLEIFTRLDYEKLSGDTLLHIEARQTKYLQNMVYMNNARQHPIVRKVKKYQEGFVVWVRGSVENLYYSFIGTGKPRIATGETFTTWENEVETVNKETWVDGEVIPNCKSMTILTTLTIDNSTVI